MAEPTPTIEYTTVAVKTYHPTTPKSLPAPLVTAPPRIADMVPGTTCDECGGSGVCGGPPDRYYDCPRCSGEPVNLDDTRDDR